MWDLTVFCSYLENKRIYVYEAFGSSVLIFQFSDPELMPVFWIVFQILVKIWLKQHLVRQRQRNAQCAQTTEKLLEEWVAAEKNTLRAVAHVTSWHHKVQLRRRRWRILGQQSTPLTDSYLVFTPLKLCK